MPQMPPHMQLDIAPNKKKAAIAKKPCNYVG
jgi:hypothetical protein